ncbi:MAG: hypothetical protein H7145_15530, partial [Akkermansiaceae bacterium]|nr:hypothetical protein [Armatimonadota bacterium]
MSHKPRISSAASRLLTFSAAVGFYAVAAISGCGGSGGGTTTGGTPSPSPSVPIGDPGRGGALSD